MISVKQQMAPAAELDEWLPGDRKRSCLAGLYLLTGQGDLARFDSGGEIIMEPELTAALSFRLQAVLSQYRSGAVENLGLGLVADTDVEQDCATGTMIFGEGALDELFGAGHGPGLSLTVRERRHKTKTVSQGMELLLNKQTHRQQTRFCPVLFVPEVDNNTLCERYGVDLVDSQGFLEVLDLSAPFASSTRYPDELLDMIRQMRRSQTEAASRSRADAREVFGADAPASPITAMHELPPPTGGTGGETCYQDGDPVTGWLLEWFSPFNELTDTQRDIIAGYETIRKVKAGTTLVERGSTDDVCIYLVEGALVLEGSDGGAMQVAGGTRRSRLPMSVLTPHIYTITASTDVSIITFSQKLIRRITDITRTYSSVERTSELEWSTTAISNGAQASYLNHTNLERLSEDD